jgi:hypothetical protein
MKARAFVIRGQYGWITSAGMDQLCLHLQSIPGCFASIYDWNDDAYILRAVDGVAESTQIMMIGFSLGAHTCTRIPSYRKKRIFDLIVGFDPSRLTRLVPVGPNVVRAICFYNPGAWLFGGARYRGNNVETYPINKAHLLVDWSSELWSKTIAAVNKTMERKVT